MTARLPAKLEVSALVRAVNSAGGFAAVVNKGEPEAGTLLVICTENGTNRRLFERMPSIDEDREWTMSLAEDTENKHFFDDYLERRRSQDPDLWIVELDIANGERFIGLPGTQG
ncbi:MAG: DUF1491 family protein [Novosphingobium sp.]